MRELALAKPETSFQILCQILLLLDSGDDGLINLLLISRLGFWEGFLRFGLALREKFGLCRDRTLCRGFGKVGVVDLRVNLSNSCKECSEKKSMSTLP